jgi:hypothetical protein
MRLLYEELLSSTERIELDGTSVMLSSIIVNSPERIGIQPVLAVLSMLALRDYWWAESGEFRSRRYPGFPASASRMAVRVFSPCLAAVDA